MGKTWKKQGFGRWIVGAPGALVLGSLIAGGCVAEPDDSDQPLGQATFGVTSGTLVPGNGGVVPGNGSIVPGNGSTVPGNGALIPGNGSLIPGNGVALPVTGINPLLLGSTDFRNWCLNTVGITACDNYMSYHVSCACNNGTGYQFTDASGVIHYWEGYMGLAPGLCTARETAPNPSTTDLATADEEQIVSACVIARMNSLAAGNHSSVFLSFRGKKVTVSRDANGIVQGSTQKTSLVQSEQEKASFPYQEAVFCGHLYTNNMVVFTGNGYGGNEANPFAFTGRNCADSPSSCHSALVNNGYANASGKCNFTGQEATSCTYGATTWTNCITTYLAGPVQVEAASSVLSGANTSRQTWSPASGGQYVSVGWVGASDSVTVQLPVPNVGGVSAGTNMTWSIHGVQLQATAWKRYNSGAGYGGPKLAIGGNTSGAADEWYSQPGFGTYAADFTTKGSTQQFKPWSLPTGSTQSVKIYGDASLTSGEYITPDILYVVLHDIDPIMSSVVVDANTTPETGYTYSCAGI